MVQPYIKISCAIQNDVWVWLTYSQVNDMLRIWYSSVYSRISSCKNRKYKEYIYICLRKFGREILGDFFSFFFLQYLLPGKVNIYYPRSGLLFVFVFLNSSGVRAKEKTAWQCSWGKNGKTQKVRCKWKVRQLRQRIIHRILKAVQCVISLNHREKCVWKSVELYNRT